MEKEKFTRGDLVWARVVYPHQWWPGLVLTTNPLGILVSFFGCLKSRYFLESEVSSFEQNFITHIKICTNKTLIDIVLKFFGQRIVRSLTLPQQGSSLRTLFQPKKILGFIRGIAVWPCVEDGDFVYAVEVFAQTTAFRHYLVNSNFHSTVQPCQVSGEKTHSVARELDTLRTGDDCLVLCKHVEKNFPASFTNRKYMDEDHLDISSMTQPEQQKTQSIQGMLVKMHILALDPFSFDGECLSNLKRSFYSFRNLLFQNIYKSVSPLERGEAKFCNRGSVTSQLSVVIYRENQKTALPVMPYMESPVNCLGLKRQLDQYPICEPALKLHKTLSFSSNGADADLWRSGKECNAVPSNISVSRKAFPVLLKILNSMPFFANAAYDYLRRNIAGCELQFFDDFFSGSQVMVKSQNLSSSVAQSLTYLCNGSLMNLIENMLGFSLVKHTSHCRDTAQICMVQKLDGDFNTLDNSEASESSADIQQLQESEAILKDDGTCISYTHDAVENMLEFSAAESASGCAIGNLTGNDEVDAVTAGTRKYLPHPHFAARDAMENMLEFSAAESVSDCAIGNLTGNDEVVALSAGTREHLSHPHFTADELKMLPTDRKSSVNVSFGDRFEDKKKLGQSGNSNLALKSKVGKLSEVQSALVLSKTLHMKFPKGRILPSKEELIKKFSPFGRVDPLCTKVYSYTGSARVVFFGQLDAVAAYQYVKRKKNTFSTQNVKFWLDPFDDKRGYKRLLTSPEYNLKSCLKKSKPLEEEDKRSPRKVRFLLET